MGEDKSRWPVAAPGTRRGGVGAEVRRPAEETSPALDSLKRGTESRNVERKGEREGL